MSDPIPGTEWYFGLRELAARIRRTVAVPDSELTARSELDRSLERAWLDKNVAAEGDHLVEALKSRIAALDLDDRQRWIFASEIERLADVCFSAGVYQPWVERLAAIKASAGAAAAVAAVAKRRSKTGTAALKAKTDEVLEVVRRHYEGATKQTDGSVEDLNALLVAVSDELTKRHLSKRERISRKTLFRHIATVKAQDKP